MHILIGALMGCVCGVVGTIVVSLVLRKPITWKNVLSGAVGGLVGGAISAATFGAGGLAAATAARAASAYVAGGAGGGAAGRAYENLLADEPLLEGVPEAAAIGGAGGFISYGGAAVSQPILRRFVPAFADFWFGVKPPNAAVDPTPTRGMTNALGEVGGGGGQQ